MCLLSTKDNTYDFILHENSKRFRYFKLNKTGRTSPVLYHYLQTILKYLVTYTIQNVEPNV